MRHFVGQAPTLLAMVGAMGGPWQLSLMTGGRTTAAVLVPLIIGQLVGDAAGAMMVGIGGLNVSLSDIGGPYRNKAVTMGVATLSVAAAAYLGTIVGGSLWLSLPLMFVFACAAGLASVHGNAAAQVSFLSLILFILMVACRRELPTVLSAAHSNCPASLAGCSLACQARLPCVGPAAYLLRTVLSVGSGKTRDPLVGRQTVAPTSTRIMTWLCGFLFALTLVVWFVTPTPRPTVSQVTPIPQLRWPQVLLPTGSDPESVALRGAILNGERIYQRLCYYCHGRQGKGDNNEYMESIGHKPADHTDLGAMQRLSDAEFFLALRDGVKDKRGWFTMPPWASVLTPTEMWDVITYVRRLSLAELPPNPAP
jgi:mono/diheme cytochrome c family protein